MRWLLDEMLPPSVAKALNERGEEAVSVYEVGLAGEDDREVFGHAVEEGRIVVTENMSDYASLIRERLADEGESVPVVFIRKSNYPKGSGLSTSLAARLLDWAAANPEPYVGTHWL